MAESGLNTQGQAREAILKRIEYLTGNANATSIESLAKAYSLVAEKQPPRSAYEGDAVLVV